jgi:uncharacterized protein YkwD
MAKSTLLAAVLVAVAFPARGTEPDFNPAARGIVDRTNAFRRDQHRPPVTVNERLTATARDFAGWMAATDFYGHEADGRQPWDRAKAHGYDYCEVAENIAYAWRRNEFADNDLVNEFVQGWEKSPGHRRNMLDEDVTETGVAVARSKDTGIYYAVQLFGRPRALRIEFRIANRAGTTVRYKVGDREYDLPANVVMTHEVCKPTDVVVGPTKARPTNGERYAVKNDGGLKLVKE